MLFLFFSLLVVVAFSKAARCKRGWKSARLDNNRNLDSIFERRQSYLLNSNTLCFRGRSKSKKPGVCLSGYEEIKVRIFDFVVWRPINSGEKACYLMHDYDDKWERMWLYCDGKNSSDLHEGNLEEEGINLEGKEKMVSKYQKCDLPLHTESRWIVDEYGKRVKLACVNWYGAEEKDYVVSGLHVQRIDSISKIISEYGFNCVRIPFSNELVEKNPIITNTTVIKANLDLLYGKTALQILDELIMSLEKYNLMVILDNHNSDANWCCSETDENGLWYNDRYPEESWISDWITMVKRYKNSPNVIGVDLRNEPRRTCLGIDGGCLSPTWGDDNPSTDWKLAAEKMGNIIVSINPDLLIIVEGLEYATDLKGVYSSPITSLKRNLVYESHDYSWSQQHEDFNSCSELHHLLGDRWGYILTQGKDYTAPVWVGEFGTCHSSPECVQSNWYTCFIEYLTDADIDWSYWSIDGTEARGDGRQFGSEETFGILNMTWDGVALNDLLKSLQRIQNSTQGPL